MKVIVHDRSIIPERRYYHLSEEKEMIVLYLESKGIKVDMIDRIFPSTHDIDGIHQYVIGIEKGES
jgi:hypothetical protein